MWLAVPGGEQDSLRSSTYLIVAVDVQSNPHQGLTGSDTAHRPPPAGLLPLDELVPEPGGRHEGAKGEVLDNLRSQLCLVGLYRIQFTLQNIKYFLAGFSRLKPSISCSSLRTTEFSTMAFVASSGPTSSVLSRDQANDQY